MNQLNNLENSSFKTEFKNDNDYTEKKIMSGFNAKNDKILCNHCGRTANNGIRCMGICVADNDY
tara:strand:- start:1294 stop:1485 length:192 start_codon:yes stop_codon:yes gene_type:complete